MQDVFHRRQPPPEGGNRPHRRAS